MLHAIGTVILVRHRLFLVRLAASFKCVRSQWRSTCLIPSHLEMRFQTRQIIPPNMLESFWAEIQRSNKAEGACMAFTFLVSNHVICRLGDHESFLFRSQPLPKKASLIDHICIFSLLLCLLQFS